MAKGDPRCIACDGRGGFQGPRGWVKCACVGGTAHTRKLTHRLNSIGAEWKSLEERERERQLKLDV